MCLHDVVHAGKKSSPISNYIITVISTVLAFVLGILCGLLLCQCLHILTTCTKEKGYCSHREKSQTRNPVYEGVFPKSSGQMISTEFELAANVAYGPRNSELSN